MSHGAPRGGGGGSGPHKGCTARGGVVVVASCTYTTLPRARLLAVGLIYARPDSDDSVVPGAMPVIGNSPVGRSVDLPRREIHTSLAREPTSYLGVCTLFMAIGEKGASRITYAAGYYAL